MIVLISGNVRQGKTLLLAIICLAFAWCGGKVHANFKIYHKNIKKIKPFDLVRMMEGKRKIRGEFIALQEIYAWMNSHKSLSSINDFESTFVFQSGKLGFHILGDAQLTMRVEGAIRKLANVRLKAERVSLCSSDDCPLDCPHLDECVFRYYYLDPKHTNEDVETGDYFDIPFRLACVFWDNYDTYDRTPPIGIMKLVYEMMRLEPRLMNKEVERQYRLLYKVRGKYRLTTISGCSKIAVEDALLQEGEAPFFASYVSNRLKQRLR